MAFKISPTKSATSQCYDRARCLDKNNIHVRSSALAVKLEADFSHLNNLD